MLLDRLVNGLDADSGNRPAARGAIPHERCRSGPSRGILVEGGTTLWRSLVTGVPASGGGRDAPPVGGAVPFLPVTDRERRDRITSDTARRSHRQIVLSLPGGLGTRQVQTITGLHPMEIREMACRYREHGPDGLGNRRRALPGTRPRPTAAGRTALAAAPTAPPSTPIPATIGDPPRSPPHRPRPEPDSV